MHLPADGHFHSFPLGAVVNETAVNILVYKVLCGHVLYFPWVEMVEMLGVCEVVCV